MFSSEAWLAKSGGFYNGVATQSLRFDRGGPKSLNRTPSSASNRKTWTWSGWIKPSIVGQSAPFFTAYGGTGSQNSAVSFNGNTFRIYNYNGSSNDYILETNAFYRDSSAWYHIAVAIDTTQGTASNRIKVYINGEQITSFSTETYPSQNFDGFVNSSAVHKIGSFSQTTSFSYDGYMAEVNFVDGLALDPTYFGETKNGVWIAKKYSGSYGTNGFRLQFNQTGTGTASASTIGADTSGNTNHWTSGGIVASDCNMPDSPENNFCTMNPLDTRSSFALSEGNTKLVAQTNPGVSRSTIGMSTGKWYFEFIYTNISGDGMSGISTQDQPLTSHLGVGGDYGWGYRSIGEKYNNSTSTSYGATYTTGDVIGVAFDADNGDLVFYKNNASQGTAFTGLASDTYFASFGDANAIVASTMIANFGQDSSFAGNKTAQGNTDANGIGDFYYAPPSGFLALCTSNLPEPTISPNADTQADDYFNTVLYTGNNSTNNITGVGFQPDWVWVKKRSTAGDHKLIDSTRGVGQVLESNTTDQEADESSSFTAFGADGFSLAGTAGAWNENANNYVAWNWKANGGTTSSNTDGSITSTVQANTDAGFSIVTYTGTGANATVGHGLDSAPEMVIVKGRSVAYSWGVYNKFVGANKFMYVENTTGAVTDTTFWNNLDSTDSVFNLGSEATVNQSSATYIAYCFHSVEGYSKFGIYTGNGSTDGTFVYTGFRPAFVLLKRTDASGYSWYIFDVVRDTYNATTKGLFPNSSSAEIASANYNHDYNSNGFKIRHSQPYGNASGGTYIYMAFAEVPFKYSTGR